MNDKPRLHQLKILTSSRNTVQDSLTVWLHECFHLYWETPSRRGKYPILRTNSNPRQLIKHAKISYSIASPVFPKFSYRTSRNGLHQVSQSWGIPSTSKSPNGVSSIHFVENLHFSLLLHRVWYLKKTFYFSKITGYHFPGWFQNPKLKRHVLSSINSHSLLFTKDMFFGKQKFDVKQLEDEQLYVCGVSGAQWGHL